MRIFFNFIKLKLLSIKNRTDTNCLDSGTFRGVGKTTPDIFCKRKHCLGKAVGSTEWKYSDSGGQQIWNLILSLLGSRAVALSELPHLWTSLFTHSFALWIWGDSFYSGSSWKGVAVSQIGGHAAILFHTHPCPTLVTLLYSPGTQVGEILATATTHNFSDGP